MPMAKLWTKNFALGTAVNFLLMVNYYALMVVVADYAMKTYDAPAAAAGLATSIFIIGALLARLVSGRVMDLVGRKRMLMIGAIGSLMLSLLYLAGLGFGALFAIRLLHGFAYGMCSTTLGTIVTAQVPDSRKGEGVGYYMLSLTLGAAIGPFLGMFLTQNSGFNVLFIVTAGVAFLYLLAVGELKVPEVEKEPLPGADGAPLKVAEVQHNGSACTPEGSKRKAGAPFSITNYLELSILSIGSVCALLFFCYSSLLAFLTPFAAENNLSAAASFFFIVYAVATFITRPFTGRLFDRKGDRIVMVPAFIAFICGMALLSMAQHPFGMLMAAALLGFGVGTIQACGLALAVRLTPDSRLSLANSTFYILLDVGVGIGPLLLGIIQPFWGYRGVFEAMAIIAVVALGAYLVVSRKKGPLRTTLAKRKRE